MARYQFTTQDRSKGGKTTASKYDMRARGRLGLIAIAEKYCNGDLKLAKECLWRTGLFFGDPVPSNYAWRKIYHLPQAWLNQVWGHCESNDDGVPF